MPPDCPSPVLARHTFGGLALLLAALASAGCASPPPPAPPPPVIVVAAPAPAPAPAEAARPAEPNTSVPTVQALLHADRMRALPAAELAQEATRLAAASPTPLVQVQLALTLMQARTATDAIRAGQLLQRVLAQDTQDARALHPLCRHLLAQLAEQKRLEDQVERQGQQVREAQRKADQLAERLDALRAIERARPRMP